MQNLNPRSTGRGDYYWFNIAIYDSRAGNVAFGDAGQEFAAEEGDGQTHVRRGDRPVHFRGRGRRPVGNRAGRPSATDACRAAGGVESRLLAGSHEMSDYRIGNAILGWEVTGLNDAAMAVKDLHAVATLKGPPAR